MYKNKNAFLQLFENQDWQSDNQNEGQTNDSILYNIKLWIKATKNLSLANPWKPSKHKYFLQTVGRT